MIFSKNLKCSIRAFALYLFLSIFFLLVVGLVKTQNVYAVDYKGTQAFEVCNKKFNNQKYRPVAITTDGCQDFCYINAENNAVPKIAHCCRYGILNNTTKKASCNKDPKKPTKPVASNDDGTECQKLNGKKMQGDPDAVKNLKNELKKCSQFCKLENKKIICSTISDDSSTDDSEDQPDNSKICALADPGWAVCFIADFLSKIADTLYGFIEDFLEIDSSEIFGSNSDDPTQSSNQATDKDKDKDNSISKIFTKFLSIANIVLAIAFLLIIYSEATGNAIGSLSRYSVQKLLPRLIIFTILVNISFYLCAMAVDISNILGANLKGMFEGMGDATLAEANQGEGEAAGGWSGLVTSSMTGDLLIIGSATASIAAIALGALSVVLPLLLLALIVLIVIWLILIIRQALVILLCVIAPVAIACALLPNTQKLFNKWKNAFIAMLIVYPAVSLIFGASYVASNILMTQDGATMKIAAMACRVIPMAAVPFVIAGSFKSVGAAGAMLSGKAQGALKKQGRKVNAARKEGFDRSIGKRGTLKASSNLANKAQKGINTITKGRFDGGRSLRKAANAYHQSEASLDSAAMTEANLAVDGMSYEKKVAILSGQDYADSYTTRAVLNDMMPNADAYSINDAMLAHAGNRDRRVRETLTGGDNKLLDINTKNAINKGNYVENKIDQSTINQSVLSNVDNKSNADIARSPSIDIEFTKGAAAMEDLRSGTTYNTDKLRGRYNNVLSDNIAASNASDDTIDSLSNV